MKFQIKFFIYFFLVIFFFGCKSSYKVSPITSFKNITISDSIKGKQEFIDIIQPYKNKLDKKMNTVLTIAAEEYNKDGQSCNLGNLISDMVYDYANEYSKDKGLPQVDFALLNRGGMRTIIPKGDITVGKVFELMPFENKLVIVNLSGKQMKSFFDYMIKSKKGHPISGLYLEIINEKIEKALIHDIAFDEDKTYYVATHDYLFNGGDSMDFFKNNSGFVITDIKIRDIFIEGFSKYKVLPNTNQVRYILK